MSPETRIVETMDAGPGRLSSAVKSLASWYRRENYRLQRERELFRQHLAGSELDIAMSENAAEQKALDAGWENSSVRLHLADVEKASGRQTGGIEQRSIVAAGLPPAVRADTGTSQRTTAKSLFGYAAVFDKWAEISGWFRERIAAGAFASALKVSDVRCLFNHDSNFVFGRSSAATLELSEDSIGLRFVCYLLSFDPASYALARRVDRRDISGCSFRFIVGKDTWKLAHGPGQIDERTIIEIEKLFDVGPVTYPAYPQTSVGATFETLPARSELTASDMPDPGHRADRWTDWRRRMDEIAERQKPISLEHQQRINHGYRRMARLLTRLRPPITKASRGSSPR